MRKVLEYGFHLPTLFCDMFFVSHVIIVKIQVIYASGMIYSKPLYYFCAIFYVWGIDFMGLLVMFIFCLLLIMSQNGWKLKPLEI